MRKTISLIIAAIMLMSVLCGCSNKPKFDQKLFEMQRAYSETFAEEGKPYFSDFAEDITGITPERVYINVAEYTPKEILEAEPKPLMKCLEEGLPIVEIGVEKKAESRKDDDYYTDEQIHDMIAELVSRGWELDFYVDNPYRTFQIRKEGIKVDYQEAADGGALHRMEDYEL